MTWDMTVLIIDDEQTILKTLGDELFAEGYDVHCAGSIEESVGFLQRNNYLCVISDIRLPDGDGMELLEAIKRDRPDTEVVMITGYGTIDSAVAALRQGAFDYVLKPFYNEEIVCILNRIREMKQLKEENTNLKKVIKERISLDRIIGKSKRMQDIFNLIQTVAPTDANILIVGESGTGKELVAEAIHHLSKRKDNPLIKMNCEVFSQSLLEDELFGHEKGAFTGAARRKPGRFEMADGGTLFLDDIDDLDPRVQVKLLRVLQEREFERIGGTDTISVDIRIISASKTDLRTASAEGNFRTDLFYRLNVVPIKLPPLRERREDLPVLIEHFLKMYSKHPDVHFDSDAMNLLLSYDWPGNVRELENTIEGTLAVAGDAEVVTLHHITNDAVVRCEAVPEEQYNSSLALDEVLNEYERRHLRSVLAMTEGKKSKAAELLGISRKSLWQKLKQHNLDPE
ncbi:MAG: sigma-54 dependent transcriptional regulator [Candidatus Auribacterota bacterium]|jgi:DNA-binding NtrC family response regulator|uniref:Sigma-54-dependent Fis family transcriptional regulator n=1 Tax=Candidatus Auribacter fodinae TaxID=2093366 RepID=A0A3A4R371_9BACT|nr:MAG: sigma-54-dependent Fis family transcriptional regulator [Candidatus Auribacter fodinae]